MKTYDIVFTCGHEARHFFAEAEDRANAIVAYRKYILDTRLADCIFCYFN